MNGELKSNGTLVWVVVALRIFQKFSEREEWSDTRSNVVHCLFGDVEFCSFKVHGGRGQYVLLYCMSDSTVLGLTR